MKTKILILTLFFLGFACSKEKISLTTYVDPFIGTDGGGNTFPGATIPFGMVKLGPDCGDKLSNSGYVPGVEIYGFSHTHVSGTGGGPKYGNILVMPFTGKFELGEISSPPENYLASPGYFAVDLKKYGVRSELSASHSVGFHRYTFPDNVKKGILINAGSFLGKGACCGEAQELVGSEIRIVSETRIEGFTRIRGGWNKGGEYTVFFTALFDTPADRYGVWEDDNVFPLEKTRKNSGHETGAYFFYTNESTTIVNMKVGISFISTEKSYENIMREINHWDFKKVRDHAEIRWNDALGKITIENDRNDVKTIFYTSLYHAMLMPTDRTGENPKWTSQQPYYDDYYAIWDTFRATHPLLTLIQKERQIDMIRSLIDIYNHEGYMPDARSGNYTGRTQGGSNCDVLIADAFLKGLDGIDYENALESMIKNAEISPGDSHQKWGRGGIENYNSLGYITTNHERAGSRTVEYAYNDYCIYRVAKGLGKDSITAEYLQRSANWVNLWRPVEDSGAKGFIMPRKTNGEWDADFRGRAWDPVKDWYPVDFTVHTAGTWSDFFYEADSWEYSFYVPHDVRGLIEKCGGNDAFVERLDTFFNREYFSVSNEPSFLTPCLYIYAGRQDRTTVAVRHIISEKYNTSTRGLPGNDDSGSMSAWAAFHLMGFYPNAGQDIYLITAPHFDKVSINLGDGDIFTIIVHDLSAQNIYINKVILNGKRLDRAWFRHDEIQNNAVLEFFMGSEPDNSWAKEPPPRN